MPIAAQEIDHDKRQRREATRLAQLTTRKARAAHGAAQAASRTARELANVEAAHPEWMTLSYRSRTQNLGFILLLVAVYACDLIFTAAPSDHMAHIGFGDMPVAGRIFRFIVPAILLLLDLAVGHAVAAVTDKTSETGTAAPSAVIAGAVIWVVIVPVAVVSTQLAAFSDEPMPTWALLLTLFLVGIALLVRGLTVLFSERILEGLARMGFDRRCRRLASKGEAQVASYRTNQEAAILAFQQWDAVTPAAGRSGFDAVTTRVLGDEIVLPALAPTEPAQGVAPQAPRAPVGAVDADTHAGTDAATARFDTSMPQRAPLDAGDATDDDAVHQAQVIQSLREMVAATRRDAESQVRP